MDTQTQDTTVQTTQAEAEKKATTEKTPVGKKIANAITVPGNLIGKGLSLVGQGFAKGGKKTVEVTKKAARAFKKEVNPAEKKVKDILTEAKVVKAKTKELDKMGQKYNAALIDAQTHLVKARKDLLEAQEYTNDPGITQQVIYMIESLVEDLLNEIERGLKRDNVSPKQKED